MLDGFLQPFHLVAACVALGICIWHTRRSILDCHWQDVSDLHLHNCRIDVDQFSSGGRARAFARRRLGPYSQRVRDMVVLCAVMDLGLGTAFGRAAAWRLFDRRGQRRGSPESCRLGCRLHLKSSAQSSAWLGWHLCLCRRCGRRAPWRQLERRRRRTSSREQRRVLFIAVRVRK